MKRKVSAGLIYVVDDQSMTAGSLAAVLEKDGFRVLTFTDPQTALNRAQWNPPRLLLVDVFLSRMSGIELAIAMNYAAPQCRLLLFSESSRVKALLEQTRQQGYSFEFVSKPFRFRELVAKCHGMMMGQTESFAGSVLPGIPLH